MVHRRNDEHSIHASMVVSPETDLRQTSNEPRDMNTIPCTPTDKIMMDPLVAPPSIKTKNVPIELVHVTEQGIRDTQEETLMTKLAVVNNAENKNCSQSFSNRHLAMLESDVSAEKLPGEISEYVSDIFMYLRSIEDNFTISNSFLQDHATSPLMRAILIEWIIEIHMSHQMYPETLHLSVWLIDRFLQVNNWVGRESLQLVGTSALMISSKYEDMCTPDVQTFMDLTKSTFSIRQILEMERHILRAVDFSLGRPSPLIFLRRYNKVSQTQTEHHFLCMFILELALLEPKLSSVKPSLQAAAVWCISAGILNGTHDFSKLWVCDLVEETNYTYTDFEGLIDMLVEIICKCDMPIYQTIEKKYAKLKYGEVSMNFELREFIFEKMEPET